MVSRALSVCGQKRGPGQEPGGTKIRRAAPAWPRRKPLERLDLKGAAGPDVRVYSPFKMLPRRENGVFICWGVAQASVGGGRGLQPLGVVPESRRPPPPPGGSGPWEEPGGPSRPGL